MRQSDEPKQPYLLPSIRGPLSEAEMEWKAWLYLLEWKEQHVH